MAFSDLKKNEFTEKIIHSLVLLQLAFNIIKNKMNYVVQINWWVKFQTQSQPQIVWYNRALIFLMNIVNYRNAASMIRILHFTELQENCKKIIEKWAADFGKSLLLFYPKMGIFLNQLFQRLQEIGWEVKTITYVREGSNVYGTAEAFVFIPALCLCCLSHPLISL